MWYHLDMYDYELKRSRRRTVALEITKDGRVVLRAPERMPKRAIEEFAAAHESWVERHLSRLRERPAPPPPTAEEIAALKARAKAVLPRRVAYYSRLMGVTPAGITITTARTRYGSCSARNRLSFSCFLMRSPEEAVDLVVVHELCHIRHKNHGPGFYAELAAVLPDHRERKKRLAPLPLKA